MKKTALLLIALAAFAFSANAQLYKGKKNKIDFFSVTPIENISATDTVATMLLNSTNGTVVAKISVSSFVFPSPLMQEHFNENYMETDKYPYASFTGKINETVDYTTDGVTNVTITGTLTIHGVAQPRTINATITVKNGTVTVDSKFNVKLDDHKITVPTTMGTKIADTIQVTVHSEMAKA